MPGGSRAGSVQHDCAEALELTPVTEVEQRVVRAVRHGVMMHRTEVAPPIPGPWLGRGIPMAVVQDPAVSFAGSATEPRCTGG